MAGRSITASVGQGGVNVPGDVITVQYLLNCVPAGDGGPLEELVLDGLVGQLTIGAIHRFQRTQFGWSDGRVDPEHRGGVTILALNAYDPAPGFPLPAPPARQPSPPPQGRPRGKGRGKKVTGFAFPEAPANFPFEVPPFTRPPGKGRGKKVTGI